jgi:hypothetical protein
MPIGGVPRRGHVVGHLDAVPFAIAGSILRAQDCSLPSGVTGKGDKAGCRLGLQQAGTQWLRYGGALPHNYSAAPALSDVSTVGILHRSVAGCRQPPLALSPRRSS